MMLTIVTLSLLYFFIGCAVFGVGITIKPRMPLWFVIAMSLIWPIAIAIGIGVSAAKEKYPDEI